MTATTRNIIEELKRAATEQGAGEAVRTIAGPALETWMRALDGKDADPERLDDLATLMTARLSIRDAALIAAVEPKLDTATVIDMAARPHASNNKTLLTETLNVGFGDPHIRPDETRLARAVREACAMADRARKHGGPVAQPYALAAYLAWWDGDGKAATLAAIAALDDDPETSSPAGEDLIIDVPSGRPIPETVHEHAEQFDPDEHVRALVRSPMKGQPGTIAELLEDAKAIQTMLDRLDAALSAPPDDDPHWEQWTAEALDEMLDDVAHKASSLAQTVLWHHHAANHGIETPENTRRQCLDTLDDLRDLMNRDASRHPLT